MYLRNSWYVALWGHELAEKPIDRTILGENIVFFRTNDADVVALEDRCPHRHLPLHLGSVVGDAIKCRYHGMEIDRGGRCILVPSQKAVPPYARVRAYPAIERYGWIWVWTGDPARADATAIPDFGRLTDSQHAAVGTTNHVRASYQLVVDNLMDLSHVGFVHTSTIGNSQMGQNGKIKVETTPTGVRVTRWVIDCLPPPTYVKTGRLPNGVNIDRWQIIDFLPPSFVQIHVGGAETGTGAPEGRLAHGLNLWVMNAMTPETAESTHYFWAAVRDYAISDPDAGALIFDQVALAFTEDKEVLEAQQTVIARRGDSWDVSFPADAGSVKSRRLLKRLIDTEGSGTVEATSGAPA